MPGPSKYYASSEARAYAWVCAHYALSKSSETPQPNLTAEDDFLSALHKIPLLTNTTSGRFLSHPLFAGPPAPALPTAPSFSLTYNEVKLAPSPAPHSPSHIDNNNNNNNEEEKDEDDDPTLALADFTYHFAQWTASNATARPSTSTSTRIHTKTPAQNTRQEILMCDTSPQGQRIAVKTAIQNGYVEKGNDARLTQLMHLLAGGAMEGGGGEDDDKKGEKGEEGEEEGNSGGYIKTQDGNVAREQTIQTGRLKGRARMDAKRIKMKTKKKNDGI